MTSGDQDRERAYEREMVRMTERLKHDIGYNPTRWMQMVGEHGAVEATRRLLKGDDYSDGLVKLWEAGLLDTSVEWFVLAYDDLFEDAERAVAARRLEQFGVPLSEWLRDRLGRGTP